MYPKKRKKERKIERKIGVTLQRNRKKSEVLLLDSLSHACAFRSSQRDRKSYTTIYTVAEC
jgi:hypothetical protein